MPKQQKHIAVIGGGMAGAAAAYRLSQLGYRLTVIEKESRIGGRVHSQVFDGAAVEMGAGFLTKGYHQVWRFLEESGLNIQLYHQHGSTGVYKDGRVSMLSLPTLLSASPLPWAAKVHVLPLLLRTLLRWRNLSLHEFWRAADYDSRSVADMYKSTSGKEFMETALQPALNGYFYWTPEQTSQAMMYILCKAAFSHGTYRLKGGLQRIPEAAVAGSEVLLGTQVLRVRSVADGRYAISMKQGKKEQELIVDGVVCATTATAVHRLFPGLMPHQRQFFGAISYSSAALMARMYKATQTKGDKAIAFPRSQGVGLSSVTLSPEPASGAVAYAALKTYASGAVAPSYNKLSEQSMIRRLTDEMSVVDHAVLVPDATPVGTYTQKWAEALPLFDVGHFHRLAEFHEGKIESSDQMLAFAGDYIGGPFMEGAFSSGLQAAERLHAKLQ